MELTLEMLLYFISDLKPDCVRLPVTGSLFSGVQQFFPGMLRKEQDGTPYLYVAELEDLVRSREELTEEMTVLAVCDAEADRASWEDLPCCLILLGRENPVPYVLNRMIDVFSMMANCDKAMHIAALEGKNVQMLLDLCEDLLGHPAIIFDSSFDVLAYTRHIPCDYALFCETIQNGYTDYGVMQKLQENKIFAQLREGEPLIAPAMGEEGEINIYLKFSGGQALLGYASVHFGQEKPDQGYLDMLRLFMVNVRFCLARDFEGSHYGQMMYETLLLNLMNPADLSEERLAQQVKNVGNLSLTGRFVLGVVAFPDEENVPLQYLTRVIAQEMWDVKPFLYNGQICLLKTLGEDTKPDCFIEQWERDNIIRLLGNRSFAIGISNAFGELTDLRYAFLQAEAALSFRGPDDRYILYGDIYPDHLLSLLEREMPLKYLQPEFYTQIKAYDAAHGTEYLKILLMYLECDCNATHAAERLFLHRNTVRNAVLFAEEHWGIRMDDAEVRVKMETSERVDRYLEQKR